MKKWEIFLKKMRNFSDKIPCIYLGLWTPTHPPPPLFWDRVLKKTFFIFTKKFGTLDPHLPIVWDKVPNKPVFLGNFPYNFYQTRLFTCFVSNSLKLTDQCCWDLNEMEIVGWLLSNVESTSFGSAKVYFLLPNKIDTIS